MVALMLMHGHDHHIPSPQSQNVDSARQAVLNDLIDRVVGLYANVICDGSMQRALSELGHFLREYVVYVCA